MTARDEVGEQLAAWGVVARLETRGRATGKTVVAAVGFAEESDGSFLIAAGAPEAAWARNLDAEPHCRLTIENRVLDVVAVTLEDVERAHAIRALILKYGTPAERLGRGPAFRLSPAASAPAATAPTG